MRKIVFTLMTLLTTMSNAFSQAGTLDPTFGTSGSTIKNLNATENLNDVTVASDGKIVAVGQTTITRARFVVARYNYNGTLDNTFNSSGLAITQVGSYAATANSVAVQPDGKIVVGGTYAVNSTNSNTDFALVRYNSDGTLDNTFGTGGIVTTVVGARADALRDIAIQPDGKIVAGGYLDMGGYVTNCILLRYNTDGSLDLTFNGTGKVTGAFGGSSSIESVLIQPDNKILAGGSIDDDGLLLRYTSTGALDNTFNSTGSQTVDLLPTLADRITCLVLQPDGNIVTGSYGEDFFGLARLTGNGSFDNTFGSSGKVATPMGGEASQLSAIDLQPDGKIVAGGTMTTSNPVTSTLAVNRYTASGALDNTFGTGGKFSTRLGYTADYTGPAVNGLKVSNNRIYLAGDITTTATNDDLIVLGVQTGLAPLPLTLLSFKGNLVDNEAHLEWETTNEVNTLEFAIEKSTDGVLYKEAGAVPTANTAGKHTYTFTDNIGYGVNGKKIYYRLKQKDLDGKFAYSGIVILNLPVTGTFVKLFPNPVADNAHLVINTSAQESITYRIIDNRGAVIRSAAAVLFSGSNSIIVNTRLLKAGSYTLDIKGTRTNKQVRFLKL